MDTPPLRCDKLSSFPRPPVQMDCQNYIRVLLVNKTEVMTCGTNAFQPTCITREVRTPVRGRDQLEM